MARASRVLLKMILGEVPTDRGEIVVGPSVSIGYYAQQHETLDRDQTLIDLIRHAKECSEGAAVAFLLKFLFTYEQCRQRIGDLSGGERSRLQLALLMLSGANFLLLDEPTNNLDIASAEVLEDALQNFEGTVLCVSHDRYFLDRMATRIMELESGQTDGLSLAVIRTTPSENCASPAESCPVQFMRKLGRERMRTRSVVLTRSGCEFARGNQIANVK